MIIFKRRVPSEILTILCERKGYCFGLTRCVLRSMIDREVGAREAIYRAKPEIGAPFTVVRTDAPKTLE